MLLILELVIRIVSAIALGSHEPSRSSNFELCLVELPHDPKHGALKYSCLIVVDFNTTDDKKK